MSQGARDRVRYEQLRLFPWTPPGIPEDDDAEHQIRLLVARRPVRGSSGINVSCTCRRRGYNVDDAGSGGQYTWEPYPDVIYPDTRVIDVWRRHHAGVCRDGANGRQFSVG